MFDQNAQVLQCSTEQDVGVNTFIGGEIVLVVGREKLGFLVALETGFIQFSECNYQL